MFKMKKIKKSKQKGSKWEAAREILMLKQMLSNLSIPISV